MKAKKIIAGVAALAMVGACGAALTACSKGETSTVKSYTISIDGKNYADWKADNEQPLDMGSGHRLWGLDTWAVGTKLLQDDNGDPVDATYSYVLDIDENCDAPGFVSYTLTFSGRVMASEAYSEPSVLVYSYQGYAYTINGGYHLMVPNYAEGSMSSECISETFGQFGGDEEDAIDYAIMEGPNGGDLYYCYTNSIIQAMGAQYHVPFMEPLLQGMSTCDVLVSGSSITRFNVDNIYAPEIKIPTPEVVVTPGPGTGEEEEEDWTSLPLIEDDDVAYDFNPGWANMGDPLPAVNETVTVVAGAYNTFEMGGKPMGWNNNQVTFEFKNDGTVKVTMLNNQGKTNEYTGTYKVYSMMQNNQYIIQLDNVAGSENPDTGAISGAVDWSQCEDADKGVGGAQVGMNIFYWISKDGKIVVSKSPDATEYGFNVALGGGTNPDAPGGGDHEGTPPFAGDHDE